MKQKCSKCGGELEKPRTHYLSITRCLKCEKQWMKDYRKTYTVKKKHKYPSDYIPVSNYHYPKLELAH